MKLLVKIFLLFLLWIIIVIVFPYSNCLFDSEKWKSLKSKNDHEFAANKSEPRKCMAYHLSNFYLKRGMTEEEVKKLLGEGSRRVIYSPEDVKKFIDLSLPSKELYSELGKVMKPKQPYYTVDIFLSDKGEPTVIKYNYELGNSISDWCSFNIDFDKNGRLIDSHYGCN